MTTQNNDMQSMMQHMESICRSFHTNPQAGTQQILEFRNHPQAIQVSQYILENSSVPEAKFHAVTIFQAVSLSRWLMFAKEERTHLKTYVANYILHRFSNLEPYIKAQMLQTLAVLWKRSWKEDSTHEEKSALFQQIQQLSQNPRDDNDIILAAKMLSAFVCEFSTSKSISIGLPLEFHREVHKLFQNFGLLGSLEISMEMLGRVVQEIQNSTSRIEDPTVVQRINAIVGLSVEVLSWQFGQLDGLHNPPVHEMIDPPMEWANHIVRPDFIGAVFTIYERLRQYQTNENTLHIVRQLILQLASISGKVFNQQKGSIQSYATFIITGSVQMLSNCFNSAMQALHTGDELSMEYFGSQVVDFCHIFHRAISNFKMKVLITLPEFEKIMQEISTFLISLLQESARVSTGQYLKFDIDGEDIDLFWTMNSVTDLLDALVSIVEDCNMIMMGMSTITNEILKAQEILVKYTGPIYVHYVECRIAICKADALRACTEEVDDEDFTEADLNDEICCMSCLGRLDPKSSFIFLGQMLQGENGCLRRLLELDSRANQNIQIESEVFDPLMEEIRLLTLFCGHLVSDESTGEKPTVPHSLNTASKTDPSVAQSIIEVSNTIIELINFQISRLEVNPNNQFLSPFLNETLLWYLSRWGQTYILPDITLYGKEGLCQVFLHKWGHPEVAQDRIGGVRILDFMLSSCWKYVCNWPQEPSLCENAFSLMKFMVLGKPGKYAVQLDTWKIIIEQIYNQTIMMGHTAPKENAPQNVGYSRMSGETKGKVLEILCTGALLKESGDSLQKITEPVQRHLQTIGESLNNIKSISEISSQVTLVLDLYRGIARAQDDTDDRILINCISPALEYIATQIAPRSKMDVSITCAILALLRDYAEVQIPFLKQNHLMKLIQHCAVVLETFSNSNYGVKYANDQDALEQMCEDLLCILQLLSHLMTKDYLDLSDEETSSNISVAEIIFFGLKQVIPLINNTLLQFTSLSSTFFSLVAEVVEIYPENVCKLDFELFTQLIEALLIGITQPDNMTAKNSLRAICGLTQCHIAAMRKGGTEIGLSLHLQRKPDYFFFCMKNVFNLIFTQTNIWDRLEICSNAIFDMIICDKGAFERLISEYLSQQPDSSRDRLSVCFQELLTANGVSFAGDRKSKRIFYENLKKFLVSAKEFRIKIKVQSKDVFFLSHEVGI